jgi:glucan biosynthesis protein C
MSLGLIGLFCRLFPHPQPGGTWLADASYWIYLPHVPLVILSPIFFRDFALPAEIFLFILTVTITLLLVSYRFVVRYTSVGHLLNGPGRLKPSPDESLRSAAFHSSTAAHTLR